MSQIKQEKFKYNYLERMKDMNDIYTDEKIREAKEFAFSLHANDRCIITNVPKSVHLKEVVDGIKTLNLHKNHLLIVGYLHDSIDYVSADRKDYLINEIRERFGDFIVQLVLETSDFFRIEDISTEKGTAAFHERMLKIKTPSGISDDAAIVILVEKVCNLLAMKVTVDKNGNAYWEDFYRTHNLKKDDVREYYEQIYNILEYRCYESFRLRSIIDKYDDLIYRIFYEKK